jgi:hypothetical protein
VGDADDPLIVRAGGAARSVAAALDLGDQLEDTLGRFHQRALPHQRDQEIELAVGLVERPAILQQPIEKPGGATASSGRIDVRIGAVADHRRRCRTISVSCWWW